MQGTLTRAGVDLADVQHFFRLIFLTVTRLLTATIDDRCGAQKYSDLTSIKTYLILSYVEYKRMSQSMLAICV